jgi:hypothetical protein
VIQPTAYTLTAGNKEQRNIINIPNLAAEKLALLLIRKALGFNFGLETDYRGFPESLQEPFAPRCFLIILPFAPCCSYLSGDGTTVNEQGALKPTADGTDNVLVKQGSFSYTSPEGNPIQLTYVADEFGFRPEGSHLPIAPVVPAPTF